MNVVLLGRSSLALRSGQALIDAGHKLVLVATAKPAEYYDVAPADFRRLARRAGAPFLLSPRFAEAATIARLSRLGADVAASVNWPSVVGRPAIAAFPHGILNAHAGDLPSYRGNACPNWAILNGESHVGLCIHQMEADRIDSGPVLLRDSFPLGADTYIGDVVQWLETRIPELFVRTLRGLANNSLTPETQPADPSLSLRCYPRRPEDSRIDWRQSADHVYRLVRASSHPFAGAFTFLEGKRRVTIWKAAIYRHPGRFLAVPGQVLTIADGDPVIACGDGCLRLTDLTLDRERNPEESRRAVGQSLRQRLV